MDGCWNAGSLRPGDGAFDGCADAGDATTHAMAAIATVAHRRQGLDDIM
jgi:hypothetical protein